MKLVILQLSSTIVFKLETSVCSVPVAYFSSLERTQDSNYVQPGHSTSCSSNLYVILTISLCADLRKIQSQLIMKSIHLLVVLGVIRSSSASVPGTHLYSNGDSLKLESELVVPAPRRQHVAVVEATERVLLSTDLDGMGELLHVEVYLGDVLSDEWHGFGAPEQAEQYDASQVLC